MAEWPLVGGQRESTEGEVTASTSAVQGTTSATANTKGNWTQLVASTPFEANAVMLFIRVTASSRRFLIDLGIGASGSEQVIVPNLHVSGASNLVAVVLVPIRIAAGARLAIRGQSPTGSSTFQVEAMLIGESFLTAEGLARVTDYGTDTSTSGGVSVDPGGTAHTKGAWSQIVASTANPIRGLIVAQGSQANAAMTACNWLVDVGIGGAGSEQVILDNLLFRSSVLNAATPSFVGAIPITIPAGTRLAVRAQCDIIDATDRLLDFALYGVD